jgi:uncharacterized protein YcfJ
MSLSHRVRRSRLLPVAAVVATLAAPAWPQTTVVVKEASPQTTVVVRQGPSEAECSARADRAAMDSTGVVGGAVRGSVGGAAVGAIVGGRHGARHGAAAGAVVGGAAGGARRHDAYRRAYDDCMRGY